MSIARLEHGKYADQLAKKIYNVDYLKGEVTQSEDYNP